MVIRKYAVADEFCGGPWIHGRKMIEMARKKKRGESRKGSGMEV